MNPCVWLESSTCTHPRVAREVCESDCASCKYYMGRLRGLGDVVHSIALVTGIAAVVERSGVDCGCAKRRAALNAVVPNPDKG